MIRSISGKWSAAFGNKLYLGARQDPNPASMSEENRISVLINNDQFQTIAIVLNDDGQS